MKKRVETLNFKHFCINKNIALLNAFFFRNYVEKAAVCHRYIRKKHSTNMLSVFFCFNQFWVIKLSFYNRLLKVKYHSFNVLFWKLRISKISRSTTIKQKKDVAYESTIVINILNQINNNHDLHFEFERVFECLLSI